MDCLFSPQLPDKIFHVRVTPGGNQGYEAITTCMFTLFVYEYPQFPISQCFLAQGQSVYEWCVGDERLMYLFIQVPTSIYEGLLLNLEM